jgi:Nuclease-related domain
MLSSSQQDEHGPSSTASTAITAGAAPPDKRARAGLEGERLTRETLARLPPMFRSFANVEVPNPRNRAGHNEADLLIAGPSALFVVEVKHHRGRVVGSEHASRWSVTHHEGAPLEPTRNAVAQVKKLVWLLREVFEAHGQRTWVQGIVVFSHPAAAIQIERTSTPCLRLDALVPYIRSYAPRGGCDRGAVHLMQRLLRESDGRRRLAA